jgi:hypothetical protein
MSVCLHATTREQLKGFSLNFILTSFAKIYQNIPVLVKVGLQWWSLNTKTHSFCSLLELDLLNIYRSENSFKRSYIERLSAHFVLDAFSSQAVRFSRHYCKGENASEQVRETAVSSRHSE